VPKIKLVTCPLCGTKVMQGYLRTHKANVHGEALFVAPLKKNTQKKAKGDIIVECSKCAKKMKRRALAAHRKKAHPSKAQRLKAILDPDEETQAEFAKRGIALSGGGFGVGKGKFK
jgi:hypothetical protein